MVLGTNALELILYLALTSWYWYKYFYECIDMSWMNHDFSTRVFHTSSLAT